MPKNIIVTMFLYVLYSATAYAATPSEVYKAIGSLAGEWQLSETMPQQGSCHFQEGTEPLGNGITFKYIGKGTTVQEDLLPDTERQMVTMYHCKDIACTNIKATHYCVKMNQPQYIANLKESTPNKIVMECDMSTQLCNSKENYVYKIIHEISPDGRHLKSSYLSKKDNKPIPSTVCNFEK